jgi:hypothetical protein
MSNKFVILTTHHRHEPLELTVQMSLKMSSKKTKVVAFKGKSPIKSKCVLSENKYTILFT